MVAAVCSHCAARRQLVGRIGVYVRPELPAICLRHRRLLGYYILPHLHEIDLAITPEILDAYRRHRRLLHRYGADTVGKAQQRALSLFRTWTHPARRLKPVELLARWDARAVVLRPHNHDELTSYPETIAITDLLTDPRWSAAANASIDANQLPPATPSGGLDVIDFRLELGRRLQLADPRHAVTKRYQAPALHARTFIGTRTTRQNWSAPE